jgi:tryptophan synthase alpha chain
VSQDSAAYLKRLQDMQLRHPVVVGFGIHDSASFAAATQYASGAIVGSAFLKALGQAKDPAAAAGPFIAALRP